MSRTPGRPEGTYTQAVRILRMRRVIAQRWPQRITAGEIAAHVDVTERTVRRDLRALELAGEVVHASGDASGWVWVPPDQREEVLAVLDRLPMRAPEFSALRELLDSFRRRRAG